MQSYVTDWSQESYGDFRNYAVAGSSPDRRRDELEAWFQHPLALATAGPADVATARSYLQSAYSPLANAAWRYTQAFGWTDVDVDPMEDYVSAQTYAMRSAGTHFGFAWSPKRPDTETSTQFSSESGALADRVAAAIHDSADSPEGACLESCTASLDGAWFNDAWQDFATWSPPALAFGNAPATSIAGGAAGPLTVSLQLAGIVRADVRPVTVTLSSSSPGGTFATSAEGPWTSSLDVDVPVGSTDALFYYRDTVAGTPSLGASAPGRVSAQQVESVTAGPLARVAVTAPTLTLHRGVSYPFGASGFDAYGNDVPIAPRWTATSGSFSRLVGPTTAYRPDRVGAARVTATAGLVSASVLDSVS
jgi:hypothetical protein